MLIVLFSYKYLIIFIYFYYTENDYGYAIFYEFICFIFIY